MESSAKTFWGVVLTMALIAGVPSAALASAQSARAGAQTVTKPTPTGINRSKVAGAYKAAVRIQAAGETGVNRLRLMQLVEDLHTELKLLAERPLTKQERQLAGLYYTGVVLLTVSSEGSVLSQALTLCEELAWAPARQLYQKGTIPRDRAEEAENVGKMLIAGKSPTEVLDAIR